MLKSKPSVAALGSLKHLPALEEIEAGLLDRDGRMPKSRKTFSLFGRWKKDRFPRARSFASSRFKWCKQKGQVFFRFFFFLLRASNLRVCSRRLLRCLCAFPLRSFFLSQTEVGQSSLSWCYHVRFLQWPLLCEHFSPANPVEQRLTELQFFVFLFVNSTPVASLLANRRGKPDLDSYSTLNKSFIVFWKAVPSGKAWTIYMKVVSAHALTILNPTSLFCYAVYFEYS